MRAENSVSIRREKFAKNKTLASATGIRAAHSSEKCSRCPSAIIQYNSGGFSNHGWPSRRGVIQSPERAISRPMEAYLGSSAETNPVPPSCSRYTASTRSSSQRAPDREGRGDKPPV